ncbi:hypothetical protein ACLOJK_025422 [Asimina triloba]
MKVEAQSSSESGHGGEQRRFLPAAQPEIMRAAEKDDHYASYVYDACRDAFRHLFGRTKLEKKESTRIAVAYQSEVSHLQYFSIQNGKKEEKQRIEVLFSVLQKMMINSFCLPSGSARSSNQRRFIEIIGVATVILAKLGQDLHNLDVNITIRDQQCPWRIWVASPYGLPPTPARRALFIVYRTAVPYIAERIRLILIPSSLSRIQSRGIIMAESQLQDNNPVRTPVQPSVSAENPSPSTLRVSTVLSRLKDKFHRLWLLVVQKWPTDCAEAIYPQLLVLFIKLHLGTVIHLQALLLVAPVHVFLKLHSDMSQTIVMCHVCITTGQGLPVLNEDGDLITDSSLHKGNWAPDSPAVVEVIFLFYA